MSTTMTRPAEPETADEAKGGKKKKLIIIVVALLVAGAAGWWFFLKPSGAAAEPVAGEVVTLEAIQVNLAGGHYLRIGVALQLTADAHEVDGSAALDTVIDLFSGADHADLVKSDTREEYKHKLEKALHEDYHGDVMEVYFTDFVTQ
ncbi:flagellar basal body-associated FliL family protein [Nocardioides seonyuensis]|nr:flagellar basal body-associated FliL family protein [Nocardioides seonyuensis]